MVRLTGTTGAKEAGRKHVEVGCIFVFRMSHEHVIMVWVMLKLEIQNNSERHRTSKISPGSPIS